LGELKLSLEDEHSALNVDNTSSTEADSPQKLASFFRERPPQVIEVAPQVLRHWTRRDVLFFGAGAIAALVGGGSLLPQSTLKRLGIHGNKDWPKKEWLLNRALRIDDDVAEALYSGNRLVPTYTKSQITPLKNNYNGATPDQLYSRMEFDSRWACFRLKRFFEHPEPPRILPGA
jgi:hypothetical protein